MQKDLSVFKRFVLPIASIIACLFMIFAAVWAHGVSPLMNSLKEGKFSFPVLFYLIVFAVIMLIGFFFLRFSKAIAIMSFIRFSWFTSLAPGS